MRPGFINLARMLGIGVQDGHERDVPVMNPANMVMPHASNTAYENVGIPINPERVDLSQRSHPDTRRPLCMHS